MSEIFVIKSDEVSFDKGISCQLQAKKLLLKGLKSYGQVTGSKSSFNLFLFFFNHPQIVISLGKNFGANSLNHSLDHYQRLGIKIINTSRGGDATLHGPGQLMIYPVMDIRCFKFMPKAYAEFLSCSIIELLANYNIHGSLEEKYPGVWVNNSNQNAKHFTKKKICAMGLSFTQKVTQHGLCLNIDCDLDNFKLLIPCGIKSLGRSVTSMLNEFHQISIKDQSNKDLLMLQNNQKIFNNQLIEVYSKIFKDMLFNHLVNNFKNLRFKDTDGFKLNYLTVAQFDKLSKS